MKKYECKNFPSIRDAEIGFFYINTSLQPAEMLKKTRFRGVASVSGTVIIAKEGSTGRSGQKSRSEVEKRILWVGKFYCWENLL